MRSLKEALVHKHLDYSGKNPSGSGTFKFIKDYKFGSLEECRVIMKEGWEEGIEEDYESFCDLVVNRSNTKDAKIFIRNKDVWFPKGTVFKYYVSHWQYDVLYYEVWYKGKYFGDIPIFGSDLKIMDRFTTSSISNTYDYI